MELVIILTAAASQIPSATSPSNASQQLHRYLTIINSEAFDPSAESSHLDKLALDFPVLQTLFSHVFCVPASSDPVERIFSQSGLIMSARRAHMPNAVLETLVFLKCNSHLYVMVDHCSRVYDSSRESRLFADDDSKDERLKCWLMDCMLNIATL